MITRLCNRGLRLLGYRLSRIHPRPPSTFLPRALPQQLPRPPIGHVAFVGSRHQGLYARGKGQPDALAPVQYGLLQRGVTSSVHATPDDLLATIGHTGEIPILVVFIFNEEFPHSYTADNVVRALRDRGVLVANEPDVARVFASKRLSHSFLKDIEVEVPQDATGSQGPLFSTADLGSGLPAYRTTQTDQHNPDRHNVEFIDTRHTFNGRQYYACIRAACFGATFIDAWIRLRDAQENDPTVHTRNIPLEPRVIEHFQDLLVARRQADLRALCKRVGTAFGPGTYVLDILPCATHGTHFVCELGMKYDNYEMRNHMYAIAAYLPSLTNHFTVSISDQLADAIVHECQSLGHVRSGDADA